MPILIDGNNLLHRLSGERSRWAVREALLERVRGESQRVTVVFDGPPPDGAPPEESLGAVTVVYAGSREADDVIVRRIPRGPQARQWVVVTDDQQLRQRARDEGAAVRSLAEWQRRPVRTPPVRAREAPLSSHEVSEWETFFDRPGDDDDDRGPEIVPRRRRR
jgi:predicted RNA-binding protein with PIN domain